MTIRAWQAEIFRQCYRAAVNNLLNTGGADLRPGSGGCGLVEHKADRADTAGNSRPLQAAHSALRTRSG